MKRHPLANILVPIDALRSSNTAVYDPEEHIIHLNSAKLRSHPLLFFRVFMHELLHHIFSPAARRGKVDIDTERWRLFNWK